jgi:ATP-dependent Clp protease ATP-binding subunit ClpC
LERRFEKIVIAEPSPAETLEILKGLRPKWEEHHQVSITDQALQAAVDLSIRFDGDHQLPDKAIDLVDKAGAHTRIPMLSVRPGDKLPTPAEVYGTGELGGAPGGEISALTIAQVLSEKIGVPIDVVSGHLDGLDRSRLLDLESFLKSRIIGQDAALESVCQHLLMAHAGLVRRRGPLAVFLFLGPSGVGKTELARVLAEFLFGNAAEMIRLDMSEYMEEHSTAKLVGSPPGYVGHEEEGQLTGRLRSKPYAVVLLDEIEKAHPRVFDMFLQVFDEGRLTDAKGRTADAHNAIFIMTTNIGIEKHARLGFLATEKVETEVPESVARLFRPEFINRIDELITFRALDEDDVRKILKPMLAEIIQHFQDHYAVALSVDEEVEKLLVRAGYNPRYGARELRRTIDKLVQVPLSKLILSGQIQQHKEWRLTGSGEGITITPLAS